MYKAFSLPIIILSLVHKLIKTMDRENQNQFGSSPLISICEEEFDEAGSERKCEKSITKNEILEEVKKQLCLAGPLMAVSLLQKFVQVISLMFVGHLGELSLSAASMANSFVSMTGFSLLVSCFFLLFNYIYYLLISQNMFYKYGFQLSSVLGAENFFLLIFLFITLESIMIT